MAQLEVTPVCRIEKAIKCIKLKKEAAAWTVKLFTVVIYGLK